MRDGQWVDADGGPPEAWVAHLRLPVTHSRFVRTTTVLERPFARNADS
jgi:hypothetical protein